MDAAKSLVNRAHDSRDLVVDYVNYWNQRADVPAKQIVAWLGIGGSKYFDWKKRYGIETILQETREKHPDVRQESSRTTGRNSSHATS